MTMSDVHPKLTVKSNSDCSAWVNHVVGHDQKQRNSATISSADRVRPRRYCAAVASGAKQLHLLVPHQNTSHMVPHHDVITCEMR